MADKRRYIPASEFCASVRDGTHDSPKPVERGRRLVTSRHLTTGRLDLSDAYLISEEDFEAINKRSKVDRWDVLISMIGTVGEPCLIKDEPDFAIKNIGLFKTKSEADGKWLYYFLRSKDAQQSIREQSRGTTQQYIPLGALRDFPILVADDPAEQKSIAAVLGSLDDKIELNRRMNATLESMARALFQSWFIDFDPVRAKLDNRHPTGMDAETAALFPDSFEHCIDGEILPKGWIKTTVGDEAFFQTGFSFQSEFFTETPPGIRLARGMNVKEGEFFWSNQSRYWPQVTPDIEQYLLRVGDVLIGMDGSKVGKNWVRVRAADLPCLLVQRVARLRESDSIGPNFIALLIGSTTFRGYVEGVKTGTTIPHISGGQIKGYSFVRPPRDDNRIFQRFESLVGPMTAQADKNHGEAEILSNLRDTLLPKLLSGDLSVAGLEPKLEIPS